MDYSGSMDRCEVRGFRGKIYPAGRTKPYVALTTPQKDYYVGFDAASAFHPQTLLCYAINGKPLSNEHGPPLQLVIPTKYGIKNLKRIGQCNSAMNGRLTIGRSRVTIGYAGF